MKICDNCHSDDPDYGCNECRREICYDCGDATDYECENYDHNTEYKFKCPFCGGEKYGYSF